MFIRSLSVLSFATLAAACGASSADTAPAADTASTSGASTSASVGGEAPATEGIGFARAIALAAPLHPAAIPFVVEREDGDGFPVIEVKLLEGTSVHEVKLAASDGSIVEDETHAVEQDDAAEMSALGAELAAREGQLERGLEMMIAEYGEPALAEVELEMHGASFVLEAVVVDGQTESVRVHDPADGSYIMTEE